MKRLVAILIVILFTLSPVYEDGIVSSFTHKKWTLMFYMATDNKMYEHAKKYLHNLTKVKNSNINMIALIDGYENNDTRLYQISDKLVKLEWENESNTGDAKTLEKFCKFTMSNYPAEHYALLVVSVGPGWQGICPDYRHGYINFPLIPIPSLAKVLKNMSRIEVVSLVACLQGMIEVAYEISSYVDYMVAMESDNAFLDIWPSIEVLNNIENGEDFAKAIARSYQPRIYHPSHNPIAKFFDKLPFKKLNIVTINTSLFAINLSRIKPIVESIDRLSKLMMNTSEWKEARMQTNEYGKWSPKYKIFYPIYDYISLEIYAYDCNIDLYDFVSKLKNYTSNENIKKECQSIMNGIKEAVLEGNKIEGDASHGMSIYFPGEAKLYNQFILYGKIPYPYEELKFASDTNWDEFLKTILNIEDYQQN